MFLLINKQRLAPPPSNRARPHSLRLGEIACSSGIPRSIILGTIHDKALLNGVSVPPRCQLNARDTSENPVARLVTGVPVLSWCRRGASSVTGSRKGAGAGNGSILFNANSQVGLMMASASATQQQPRNYKLASSPPSVVTFLAAETVRC